jgi:hypothetical protein
MGYSWGEGWKNDLENSSGRGPKGTTGGQGDVLGAREGLDSQKEQENVKNSIIFTCN